VVVVAVTWLTIPFALSPGNPLVVAIAVLFVLVAPGYAIVSALFPARRAAETSEGHRLDVRGLDFPERLALGVGTSVVVAPFVAFALRTTVVGIDRAPVLVVLGALTLAATAVAAVRWRALPPGLRYQFTVAPLRASTTADRLLVVVVAVAVVVAVSSVGYATTTARGGEDITEFYVLAVQEDGSLLADNYPSSLTLGESARLFVGLDNHRGTDTTYTVVAVAQQVDLDTGEVLRQEEFQRYTTTVDDGDSWGVRHEFTPVWTGVNVRVTYLLYVGNAPPVASAESAEESVHLWVDVVDPLTADGPRRGGATGASGAGGAGATDATGAETTGTTGADSTDDGGDGAGVDTTVGTTTDGNATANESATAAASS
jgi:uncharacterized membrane protein